MLATQLTDSVPEAENAKQWIKEKLAQTLKTLQRRYVTTDSLVTSEESEANQLCCALEAIFIHGLRSKFIRTEGAGARNRKAGPLPQPVFWNLLKAITHRDVIMELEGLSFINSDVGRCRAWVRLALNDGLLECYLTSLLRESTQLGIHYQPGALLLDPEEREVLLSLLQGLASLAFQLSYKSAVLNEWTTTPLALAGLCHPLPTEDWPPSSRRESCDTASLSSGSGGSGRGQEGRTSSDLSLDNVSCHLSSSFGSERGSCCGKTENNNALDDSRISSPSIQDIIKTPDVPSPATDSITESSTHSSSDEDSSNKQDIQENLDPFTESSVPNELSVVLQEEPLGQESEEEQAEPLNILVDTRQITVKDPEQDQDSPDTSFDTNSSIITCQLTSNSLNSNPPAVSISIDVELQKNSNNGSLHQTSNGLSRKTSTGSVYSHHKSSSWISDEDIYKPENYANPEEPDDVESTQMNGAVFPVAEPEAHLSPPSVVRRRQIGLSNPFRGLLKLGQLERRGPMGLWRTCYCELSPFELRLYSDDEERNICENRSLLRCEDVHLGSEGRFHLEFSGKRLQLRASCTAEAEDWVDRIFEAVSNVRHQPQDDWDDLSPVVMPVAVPPEPANLPETDWSRPCEPEPDAIKEAVVLLSWEAQGWRLMVLSLSLEALQGFSVQNDCKTRLFTYAIDAVRDVVPAVALGGPAFFKILTAKETLTAKAENGEEARIWRSLIRKTLDSYLDEENETGGEMSSLNGGNVHRLVHHRLKGDAVLLPYLTVVPKEKGLNSQNFKCAGCFRQIGVSLGRARLCEFSAQYYCDTCHQGDTTIIPSRMVHNWDLAAREVSRQAMKLLAEIEPEPLLNLDLLNPNLFDHSETMATVQGFRQRLRLLGDYLLICRSGIRKKVEARLQQRTYLLESSHMYSVLDFRQIADGQYESFLQSLIQFSCNHVHHCDLCTQRGFICQICNTDEIIFPFQFDTTSRCKVCKAVFHSTCKDQNDPCPRCERLQRYKERELLE
ncbi:pleckstrin-likey domain-containing family M member 1 isoform 1 [Silurus asotus]|uniref:Pleckstrin-likey domain-containing family M member 1 isoform 1 n=1 Tax=Silurus asotus TaxID=30991 RepID=A0AAD5FBB5_SILAS|nr:pleckstrin-likey domain-containing family M member 1 isoform 1 [Silurus asotus]